MEKKNKFKTVICFLLAHLCTIITLVGAFIGGIPLKSFFEKNIAEIMLSIAFILLLVLFITNIILKFKATKRLNKMKVREANDFMLKKKADIKSDFEKATKSLHRTSLLCKLYVAFLVVILHLASFFAGVINSEAVGLVVIFYFFTSGIYVRIAGAILNKPTFSKKECLPREEFSELYSIAGKAMNDVRIKGNLYICTERSFDGSIGKYGNDYLIVLGCNLVNCLSRDEIYNVLLHEFAHVSKDYTPKSINGFFHRFMEYDGDNFYSYITDAILAYAIVKYAEEYIFYTMLASEYIESMADKVVLEKGNPRAFASALAKCNLHTSYERIAFLYNEHTIFESEEPRGNLATEYLENFRIALNDNMERWLDGYERELQPRNATHPIYKLRREAVGVKAGEVEITFDNFDEELKNEAEKLLDFTNKMLVKNLTPHYEQSRKTYYLEPLSIVEAWEKDKQSYSVPELSPVIDALAGLNRHREAEKLCDEIIANEKNIYKTAYARFFKGFMLLNYDDASGIDMLYKVIELNSGYADGCLTYIGEFACRNGMQKELDEYREKAISISQKNIDEDSQAGSLSAKDNLVADIIDAETLNKHIEFITSCSNKICSIYLVRKIITDTFYSRVFVVDFDKGTDVNEIGEAMDKIFRYLDLLDGEQYSLFFANDVYKNIIKKIDGSLIYKK